MSHAETINLDIAKVTELGPVKFKPGVSTFIGACLFIGLVSSIVGLWNSPAHFWGVFFTNYIYWQGVAVGCIMISVIVQIVRAKWAPPIRRIAESTQWFLVVCYGLFFCTYFGREYLFSWAKAPMPGREWWMQPWLVYTRFGILLLFFFCLIWRYVALSLRGDVGYLREKASNKSTWTGTLYKVLVRNWKGRESEKNILDEKLSWNAPLIVALYAVIYSLFVFEMVMGMNVGWFSNMFGGFMFIGNIYCGWAMVSLIAMQVSKHDSNYSEMLRSQQLHDLGKLTLGFCMLWAYMFISQFLPIWYGNLPEETQWIILRIREYPWKGFAWVVFAMCFIIPFILLLSRDLKKYKPTFTALCSIVLIGMFLERYIIVMPEIFPNWIPFGFLEIGMFLGFMGLFMLCVYKFLETYPMVPLSHKITEEALSEGH